MTTAGTLQCATCGCLKPATEFSSDVSRPRGRKYSCRKCLKKTRAAKYAANPEKYRNAVKASYRRNYLSHMLLRAKKRAKAKGLRYALGDPTTRDLLAGRLARGRCELSGFELEISAGHKWNSPALDRINPRKGYTYGNVRIICHALNNALGNWGAKRLFALVDAWRERGGPV